VTKDQQIVQRYKKENPWGMATCIDLYGCDHKTMTSAKQVTRFVHELCDLIKMKRFGKTVVVNFGADPRVSGFSMTQLIETSLISGHFADNSDAIYLDVFSCKAYPPYKTAEFAKKFFGAKKATVQVSFRK
jgi:S-adenosylmethionine/arginine decarboxylase-like enzyme